MNEFCIFSFLVCLAFIFFKWNENFGEKSSEVACFFLCLVFRLNGWFVLQTANGSEGFSEVKKAFNVIVSNPAILNIGIVSACFEASM